MPSSRLESGVAWLRSCRATTLTSQRVTSRRPRVLPCRHRPTPSRRRKRRRRSLGCAVASAPVGQQHRLRHVSPFCMQNFFEAGAGASSSDEDSGSDDGERCAAAPRRAGRMGLLLLTRRQRARSDEQQRRAQQAQPVRSCRARPRVRLHGSRGAPHAGACGPKLAAVRERRVLGGAWHMAPTKTLAHALRPRRATVLMSAPDALASGRRATCVFATRGHAPNRRLGDARPSQNAGSASRAVGRQQRRRQQRCRHRRRATPLHCRRVADARCANCASPRGG